MTIFGSYLQNIFLRTCRCRKTPLVFLMKADEWYPTEAIKRSATMRFMVIVKASKDSEAGVMPSTELLTAMGKFNEEMVKAGIMEAGEGLHPTSKGSSRSR